VEEIRMCRICGRRPAVTKEHLPSQGAGNIGETEVVFIDGNLDREVQRIQEIFEQGFYRRVLCGKCNSKYGSFYNTVYTDFVNQIRRASGIRDPQNRVLVHLEDIYPGRILKQMLLMYLCIQPREVIPGWEGIRDFVKHKERKLPSGTPRIYVYKNISNNGRIVPWMGLGEVHTQRTVVMLSEISYPPIGIVFCDQQDDRFSFMEDITNWGQYGFKEKSNFVIHLPELHVSTDHPLGFGTEAEVEKWIVECGVVRFIPRAEDSLGRTSVGLTLRRRNDD
jgi:hypothetical protein